MDAGIRVYFLPGDDPAGNPGSFKGEAGRAGDISAWPGIDLLQDRRVSEPVYSEPFSCHQILHLFRIRNDGLPVSRFYSPERKVLSADYSLRDYRRFQGRIQRYPVHIHAGLSGAVSRLLSQDKTGLADQVWRFFLRHLYLGLAGATNDILSLRQPDERLAEPANCRKHRGPAGGCVLALTGKEDA